MVDQVSKGEVDNVMLEQSMPTAEGETLPQGAVGGRVQGDGQEPDIDEYGFPIPNPNFDIDAPGYDMWRDPY